jgi:hypothetical protein
MCQGGKLFVFCLKSVKHLYFGFGSFSFIFLSFFFFGDAGTQNQTLTSAGEMLTTEPPRPKHT